MRIKTESIVLHWSCGRCNKTAEQELTSIGESGTAICPECGDDMTLGEECEAVDAVANAKGCVVKNEHTPGPWDIVPQTGGDGPIIGHRYETGKQMNPTGLRLVCQSVERGDSLTQDRANACLIASSPDLLAACVYASGQLGGFLGCCGEQEKRDSFQGFIRAAEACDAAIAKAKAVQP